MTLGKQISRLRAAKGLSQEDLANDLQVSRQSISKWETDTSVPELDKLLKLSEFQNPLTGLNFQGTGKLTTPLGANLLRTSVLPAGTAIGLDKRFALEMVQGSDVTVEYDKLIDRQLERAAVTTISGFAKVFKDASRVLEVKK